MAKLYSGKTIVFYVKAPNGSVRSGSGQHWEEIQYVYQKIDELDKDYRDLTNGAATQGRVYEQRVKIVLSVYLL